MAIGGVLLELVRMLQIDQSGGHNTQSACASKVAHGTAAAWLSATPFRQTPQRVDSVGFAACRWRHRFGSTDQTRKDRGGQTHRSCVIL